MEKRLNKHLYYPLRALTMALFILLIRRITNRRIINLLADPEISSQIPEAVLVVFSVLCTVLITNSVINLFTVYDKGAMFDYLDKKRQEVSFPREIKEILSDRFFYIETVPHMAITVLFVCLDLYGEFTYLLSFAGIISPLGYFIVSLICALIVLSCELLTRYEAKRYWHHLKNNKGLDKLESKPLLIFKAVLILTVYPFAAPYLPYIVFMLFTLAGLVVTIATSAALNF